MKLIMLRGLPGSGKTTRAREIMKGCGNYVRVNRDLLREMLHFGVWSPKREGEVIEIEKTVVSHILSEGVQGVIIDDCNLGNKHFNMWNEVAQRVTREAHRNVQLVAEPVDCPIELCIERDAARAKPVGKHTIIQMAMQYEMLPDDNRYVLCDLDGTLADIKHRLPVPLRTDGVGKDWAEFFSKIPQDTLRTDVWERVRDKLETDPHNKLVLLSGRNESTRAVTEKWLADNGITYLTLIMRRESDHRDDPEVKIGLLRRYFPDQSKIVCVFDDRPRVLRAWEEAGLSVIDCGDGIDF